MSLYFRKTNPNELRDLSDVMRAWLAVDNPKRHDWELAPDRPAENAIWNNGQWIIPEPYRVDQVTPAQIRGWLIIQGIPLEQVSQFIDAIEDATQRELARVKWEYGLEVWITDPLVAVFASKMGLDEKQLQAAFDFANTLFV